MKIKRKHWYKFYIGECPVCGRWKGWKKRIYGRKPKDKTKRYIYLAPETTYDSCLG